MVACCAGKPKATSYSSWTSSKEFSKGWGQPKCFSGTSAVFFGHIQVFRSFLLTSMIQSVCSCRGSYQQEPNVLEVGDDMLGSGNWRLRAHGTSERCAPKVP